VAKPYSRSIEGTIDVIAAPGVVRVASKGLTEPPLTLVKMRPDEARELAQQLLDAAEQASKRSDDDG
jgi:hypothetical protein